MDELKSVLIDSTSDRKAWTFDIADSALKKMKSSFDAVYGGFSGKLISFTLSITNLVEPKFPTPPTLSFLLTYSFCSQVPVKPEEISGDEDMECLAKKRILVERLGLRVSDSSYLGWTNALEHRQKLCDDALTMATKTLKCINRGGIHDHIGGGFHRYSTDRYWHV